MKPDYGKDYNIWGLGVFLIFSSAIHQAVRVELLYKGYMFETIGLYLILPGKLLRRKKPASRECQAGEEEPRA